jgi:hypothetical protein
MLGDHFFVGRDDVLVGLQRPSLVLEGGTHNPLAPPFEFLAKTFLPLLQRMGTNVRMKLDRHGFYPAGGGKTRVTIEPAVKLARLDLTERGGEGMVVKPLEFVVRGSRGLVQPAVKCRGPEYLRIIYGPEYTAPEHLERLRARRLAAKRSLALREFALGIDSLERFVRKEPLRRVHECVFGVLALESEPVDPRL